MIDLTRRPLLIAAGGILAFAVASVAAWASYDSANQWVEHTQYVQRRADEWAIALLDAEASARAHARSATPVDEGPFAREREAAGQLEALVVDNAEQVANVRRTREASRSAVDDLHAAIALADAGHRDEASARLDGSAHDMRAFRDALTDVRNLEARLLVARRSRASTLAAMTLASGGLLALASFVVLALAWTAERRRTSTENAGAHDAKRRLEALSDLAAKLAETRTRAQVADVVVDHGIRIAGADTCTLYVLDDTRRALELIGDRGVQADVLERGRRITETSETSATFATLASGEPLWAETPEEYQRIFPSLAPPRKSIGPRARAFWSVPLVVEGRAIGLLGMGFYEPRAFAPAERAFIVALTNLCAQAVVRAARLEREDEAARWFETTLHSIGDGVIATDARGNVRFLNSIAERLTGWSEAEARGRPLDEVFCIFSERTRETAESPVAKVLREGVVVGLANHTVLRSRRGTETPIDDSAAPIRDDAGKLYGVVLVFRDVTEEKGLQIRREFLARAGEALVSSVDYKTTLATVARFAVPELADWCAVDLAGEDGRPQQVAVAHVDPAKVAFAKELGERYPADVNAPRGVPNVIRTGVAELYSELPPELVEQGAQDAEHLRIIRELALRSAMCVPLRASGKVLGAMTFVYAESNRRYTQSDLDFAEDFARRAAMAIENATAVATIKEARAEAELASRAKDEFLATVSHELRTPLNAILGWTVLLRKRGLAPDLDHPLGIIERNARAQTRLIEDVLDVARVISGKLVLDLEATDAAKTVESCVEAVTPSAKAKDIAIRLEIAPGVATVHGDGARLQQVVSNLLTNAVKFTPKGGTISVRVTEEDGSVCIRVKDDGHGIHPSALPHVFEAFRQADASITRRHGGLGLGLAIAKHIVQAHGGDITAESEGDGRGALFTVRLPVRSDIPSVAPARAAAVPRLDGLRVLVVDDEDDARQLVATVLRDQGAEVRVAGNGAEAIDAFRASKPDVLVSDIGMPDMDGYALIRRIRALSPADGGRTPAVALTAFARADDAERAFAAGYQRHIAKPIEPSQLATLVANLGGITQANA